MIDHPEVKKRILVSLTDVNRRTEDGIDIVHFDEFVKILWEGELF